MFIGHIFTYSVLIACAVCVVNYDRMLMNQRCFVNDCHDVMLQHNLTVECSDIYVTRFGRNMICYGTRLLLAGFTANQSRIKDLQET